MGLVKLLIGVVLVFITLPALLKAGAGGGTALLLLGLAVFVFMFSPRGRFTLIWLAMILLATYFGFLFLKDQVNHAQQEIARFFDGLTPDWGEVAKKAPAVGGLVSIAEQSEINYGRCLEDAAVENGQCAAARSCAPTTPRYGRNWSLCMETLLRRWDADMTGVIVTRCAQKKTIGIMKDVAGEQATLPVCGWIKDFTGWNPCLGTYGEPPPPAWKSCGI